MAIQVIKLGKDIITYKTECWSCETIFSFNKIDTIPLSVFDVDIQDIIVHCPTCNHESIKKVKELEVYTDD